VLLVHGSGHNAAVWTDVASDLGLAGNGTARDLLVQIAAFTAAASPELAGGGEER
jgi:hypothetical protein